MDRLGRHLLRAIFLFIAIIELCTGEEEFDKFLKLRRNTKPEYPDCKDRTGDRTPNHNWVVARRKDDLKALRAVEAGVFLDGLPTYVARLYHDGNIIPGIARPNEGAWAPHENIEVHKDFYEVIVSNNVTWVPATDGHVPPQARHTGILRDGTKLYSCRVMDTSAFILESGMLIQGRPCSIPWVGKPALYNTYEVLIYT